MAIFNKEVDKEQFPKQEWIYADLFKNDPEKTFFSYAKRKLFLSLFK